MLHYLNGNLEPCTCSPEQVEEYLRTFFLDIDQSEPWKLKNTQEKYCSPGNEMESCHDSQSGTMSAPLTENHGEDELTLFAVDFPAKTLVMQEKAQESQKIQDQDCGLRWQGSFTKYDPTTSLWKTHQLSLLEGLESFSETWPKWGIMLHGECWELEIYPDQSNASGFGLPAPTKAMGKRGWGISNVKPRYSTTVEANARVFGYKPHPSVLEWSMGWIPTWTRLGPLETDRFHKWLHSHGEY